jgi:hypothetical protein
MLCHHIPGERVSETKRSSYRLNAQYGEETLSCAGVYDWYSFLKVQKIQDTAVTWQEEERTWETIRDHPPA